MTLETTVPLDGLTFPEGPRWRDGRLWFSDIHARRVMAVDLTGQAETIVEVSNGPSGTGWLPDGRLLVVSTADRRLLRLDSDGLSEAPDLSHIATFWTNDMVVDAQGHAYIGGINYNFYTNTPAVPGQLLLVTPDGRVSVAASDMMFPNGAVVAPNGHTLIVAERLGTRLTLPVTRPLCDVEGRTAGNGGTLN